MDLYTIYMEFGGLLRSFARVFSQCEGANKMLKSLDYHTGTYTILSTNGKLTLPMAIFDTY
ncbi:MAG TPA: hypothetical protein PKV93_03465 [Fervidobacterium sp.]|nr:hypothetical protein [Fervidobacterium sp.]